MCTVLLKTRSFPQMELEICQKIHTILVLLSRCVIARFWTFIFLQFVLENDIESISLLRDRLSGADLCYCGF